MSMTAVILQGTIKPDGTLAEKLNLPAGRVQVQVTVQPLPDISQDPFWQRLQADWSAQAQRGHTPRTSTEVEAQRQAARNETEEEIQEALRLQEACREARQSADVPPKEERHDRLAGRQHCHLRRGA